MSPQEIDTLRKDVKKMLVDLDLDSRNRGAMRELSEKIAARMARPVSTATLAMALSGYRKTEAYQQLLIGMSAMLTEMLSVPSDPSVNIHG
jgi:hypothetical protein